MRQRNALISLFLLFSCAGPSQQQPNPAVSAVARAEGRLSLEVLVLRKEGGTRSLGHQDAIEEGESYNLRVLSDRPVFLTVLQASNSGDQRVLLPSSGQYTQAQPGIPTLIPEHDALTASSGQARIIVLASAKPPGPSQVQEGLAQVREAAEEVIRNPPPVSGPGNRPGELRKILFVPFEPDGSAALGYSLVQTRAQGTPM